MNRGVESWGNDGVHGDWATARFSSVLGAEDDQRGQVPVGPRLRIPEQPGPHAGRAGVGHRHARRPWTSSGTARLQLRQAELPRAARRIPTSAASTSATCSRCWSGSHLVKFGARHQPRLGHPGQPVPGRRRLRLQQPRRLHQRLRSQHQERGGAGALLHQLQPGRRSDRVLVLAPIDFDAFIQDTWHVNPRTTLNLGPALRLRADAGSADSESAAAGAPRCSRATRTTSDRASASPTT